MSSHFKPMRVIAEVLLAVALAELSVMLVLPVIAPNTSPLQDGILDVSLLLLLSGPVVFWRVSKAFRAISANAPAPTVQLIDSRGAVLLAAFVQVLGLSATCAGVWWQYQSMESISASKFEQGVERTKAEILRVMNQPAYGLRGALGAIAANPNFNRSSFRAYVQSRDLNTEFPGIRGFGYIERVKRSDLTGFIARERKDGAPDFQVKTTGDQPYLYVVKYIEPLAQNSAVLGLDLGQLAGRREALEYAMSTGEQTVLGGIQLIQDKTKSSGLLLIIPFYRNGTKPQTVTERQRDLAGFLYAPIVASEMLGRVSSITDRLIDFEVYEGTVADPYQLVFDADGILSVPGSMPGSPVPRRSKFSSENSVVIGSQIFTIRCTSSTRFEAEQDHGALVLIAVGGVVISFLMSISVWLLAIGRQRAQELAASMTEELDRMAQVVQHTENSVTVMDPQMRITWVNKGFTRMTGYTAEEATGKTPGELLGSGKADPAVIHRLLDAAQRKMACRVEIINRAKSGSEYWVETEIQPRFDKSGAILGFMEIGSDITQQKETRWRLETAIRETASLLNTVETHAIVSTADANGTITHVNESFCRISGYSAKELVGQNHRVVRSTVHGAAFWKHFWDTIQSGKPWRGEVCNQAKDGSLYWVDSMVAPFVGTDGRIEKFVSILTDITARKRTEAALAVSNALMEESQSVAKVGGWLLDLRSGNLIWTAETYRIHETSPEQFNPSVDAGVSYFLPESRVQIEAALEAAIGLGTPYDLELETLTTRGNRIDVRTTGTATLENGKVVQLSGIFQDITQRKSFERSLQEARLKAEDATRSKSEFLANMSHEIRTPMNAMLGMLKLLEKTTLTKRQEDYVEKAAFASSSLLGLINDILDYSKVDAGKLELDPQPMQIDKLMRGVAVILSAYAGDKGIDILMDVDPALPTTVMADSLRLQQVLVNLGGNAIKFTENGHVLIVVRQALTEQGATRVSFSVTDSGIGISPENQARLFTAFTQAEASTTRKFGGTGLGLTISKRLVELMGGNLGVESTLGEGATFKFALDLKAVEADPADNPLALAASQKARSVLVVDDNPIARELLSRVIRSWHWPVESVAGASAALDRINRDVQAEAAFFDLIYVDWQMPGADGWECIRGIRTIYTANGWPAPTVVLLSSSSRDMLDRVPDEDQRLIDGFIVKPWTPSLLLESAMGANASGTGVRSADQAHRRQFRLRDMRILVVEDNLINQQVAEELLTGEGASVSLASNGRFGVDAVEAAHLKGKQFDCVLMDVQMPVMDGYEATHAIRETLGLRDLPIIAMTANALPADRAQCIAAGMNEHVGKPFDLHQLVNTLLQVTGYRVPQIASQDDVVLFTDEIAAPSPAQASIQVHEALSRMGGNSKLYWRTVRDFLQVLPNVARDLRSAIDSDTQRAVIYAHTIKGNASTLGATRLAAECGVLEKMLKSGGEAEAVAQQLQLLENEVAAARTVLQALLEHAETGSANAAVAPQATPPSHGVVGNAPLTKVLALLAELLKGADLTALELFADHRAQFDALPTQLVAPLEESLQSLDLAAALEQTLLIQSSQYGQAAV